MVQKDKFTLLSFEEISEWISTKSVLRPIKVILNNVSDYSNYSRNFNGYNHFTILQNLEKKQRTRSIVEIAQHITTFPDEKIMICRSFEKAPEGIKNGYKHAILIEHLVDHTNLAGTSSQYLKTIVSLNALLCYKFNLNPNSLTIINNYTFIKHWIDSIYPENTKVEKLFHHAYLNERIKLLDGNNISECGEKFSWLVQEKLESNYKLKNAPTS